MTLIFQRIQKKLIDYALECHCRICHASNNFRDERPDYHSFREQFIERGVWEESRKHMARSLKDPRTILDRVENQTGDCVGYCWVVFSDWYEECKADINGILVEEPYRRQGIGLEILQHIEKEVRLRGATVLVSDTGVDNVISQAMHERYGFEPRWYTYHRWL